jgi:ribonuclease R
MPKKINKDSKDPFLQRESSRYDNPVASREYLLELINTQKVPVSIDHIAESLQYADEDRHEALRRRLQAMVRDGQIFKNRRGGFLSFDHMDLEKGVVQAHADGFGFLTPESGGKDIFLPERQMRKLMNGDRAAVKIESFDKRRDRREGFLISVLERAHETVVGRFYRESGIELVIPDDKRLNQDVLINREVGHSAEQGDIVIVQITEFPTQHNQPIGVIQQVLGHDQGPGMEVTIALNSHSIPHLWPDDVNKIVKTLPAKVAEEDKTDRQDLRELAFVTIDGSDARDFDDAVYCERTRTGFKLYVAIADVAHYVKPGSALDDEAQRRGTSVYFPGEVIPMLPEVLSNGLCSLNPQVDRLCMVCCMTINKQGGISRYEFSEAVIHSHARLIYEEVAILLFDQPETVDAEQKALIDKLIPLREVYAVLSDARKQRRAIEFETKEVVFKYNKNRKIETIEPIERNEAHKLIEECMIAANISAAKFLKKRKVPTLYRMHEGCNSDKLPNLVEFLASFGIHMTTDKPTPADYANVIEQAHERPEFSMIQTIVLRSMLQASYGPDAKMGHFGLALSDYAHFTSPIRRYPDLIVHRGIKHCIKHATNEGYGYDLAAITSLGETCSRFERRADDATRDAADWLKCEFLQKHIGKQFNGQVSGVTSFGLFVQLDDLLIDGLVHVTSLKRDYYHYDPVNHRLVGELTSRQYQLGDRLTVEVSRVSLEDRKIDFDLIASHQNDSVKGRPKKKGLKSEEIGRKKGKNKPKERKTASKKTAAKKPAQNKPKQKNPDNKKIVKKKPAQKNSSQKINTEKKTSSKPDKS